MTAGLTWAPEMRPRLATTTTNANPPAIGTAGETKDAPATGSESVAATAVLMMANTSTNVPLSSAVNAGTVSSPILSPCRLESARISDLGLLRGRTLRHRHGRLLSFDRVFESGEAPVRLCRGGQAPYARMKARSSALIVSA